jgi:hypothetical protein
MAAAANSHEQIVLTGKSQRINDVGCSRAAHDEGGTPLMHRVEDRFLAVSGITWLQDVSTDCCRELLECRFVHIRSPAIDGRDCNCHENLLDVFIPLQRLVRSPTR